MEQMTVKDIIKATGGVLLCGEADLPLAHICIDSKKVKGGELFVPLVGERVDAHRFIPQAFDAGAAAVLTSRHHAMEDTHPWIQVEDTKKALQAIGSYYRDRLSLPLVGVTGSVGKTTTREMVGAALSAGFRVYKTPGNYNSQVGLPITLTEITSRDEIGVLELGMSMPGEMAVISRIARVDMAVITNVDVAHIEQLGSQENIFREKMSIQEGLREGGTLFLNGDDPMLQKAKAKAGCQTVYYGTGENCQYRAEDIRLEDGRAVFTAVCGPRLVPVRLNVMGRHFVHNALAALAVADANGVPMEAAAGKLEGFTGFQGRQQVYERDGITIIDDAYNASPVSLTAALEVLLSFRKANRRIAVVADMKELGPEAASFHENIGIWLAAHPVEALFTLGELAKRLGQKAMEGSSGHWSHFPQGQREGLYQELAGFLRPGDCVLLKGSNSMKLGEVAARLVSGGK